MSTDLATVANNLPAHLRGAKSPGTLDEFAGGLAKGIPLPFLSIRGKEFRLRKDGQELNTRQREMSVIFIAARHSVSKRYYEKKYESGSLEAPDCSSRDGVTPDVSEPVHSNCAHCPKNQWGSRITEGGKEGKACSDYKRVILWPVGLTDDPMVLDVAATSLKAPKGQKHTVLMLGDYLSQLAKHGMDPTQVVTKVAFTDAEYPQLCFTFERFVDEDEWLRVQELRDSDEVAVCIDEPLFAEGEDGKVKDAEEPTEKPKATRTRKKAEPKEDVKEEPVKMPEAPAVDPFPGKTTVMLKDGDMEIAEDEETWADLWADGYRPKPPRKAKAEKQPDPEPEAKAETKAAADPSSDDLLAEVAALLGKK